MKPSHRNLMTSMPACIMLVCIVLVCITLAACGTPGAPMPPELELARPVTDLRAARKGDRVFLAWTVPSQTTDHQTVRHPGPTRICRSFSLEIGDCKTPAAEIPAARFPVPPFDSKRGAAAPRIQATYTDTLPQDLQTRNPTAQITYALSVLNESGRSAGLSNMVQVPSAPTFSPPENFSATVRSDGVLLSWDCSPATGEGDRHIGHRVRIYRREQSKQNAAPRPAKISDIDFANCSQPQYLDQTFEWEKSYDYFASVVTVVSLPGRPEVEVEGIDSAVVPVFAHDTFPPAAPTGLQAVFSGVGQAPFVDLVWAPDTDADLAGYNIFRREDGSQPVKLNADPLKAPAYHDTSVQSGKKYFYSVAAIDERNNQSTPSEEASEQVP
jgi:hypothetical protein